MSSALFHPWRVMNSWKGSTTASRKVLGGDARCGSLTISVIAMPGNMNSAVTMNTMLHGRWSARISDSEPGTSPGDAIGVDVDRIAQSQLRITQQFAPIGIDRDVLRGGEEGEQGAEQHDGAHLGLR